MKEKHTVTEVLNHEPVRKTFSLADHEHLGIVMQASGHVAFEYSYHVDGKRKPIVLPGVRVDADNGLKEALRMVTIFEGQRAQGIDPYEMRRTNKRLRAEESQKNNAAEAQVKLAKAAGKLTYAAMFNGYLDDKAQGAQPLTEHSLGQIRQRYEAHIKRYLGQLAMPAISGDDDLKPLLRKLLDRPTTCSRVLKDIEGVFDHAIYHHGKLVKFNPATAIANGFRKKELKRPKSDGFAWVGKTHPDVLAGRKTKKQVAAQLVRDIFGCEDHVFVRLTITLMHFAKRSEETHLATWDEIDFDNAVWRIPADRMKMEKGGTVHLQPIGPLMLARFRAWKEGSTSKWMFPGVYNRRISCSQNGVRYLLRRLGYVKPAPDGNGVVSTHTPHGFRKMFSSLANDEKEQKRHAWGADTIEAMLDHMPGGTIRAVYNDAEYQDSIRAATIWWEQEIQRMVSGADVLTFPGKVA